MPFIENDAVAERPVFFRGGRLLRLFGPYGFIFEVPSILRSEASELAKHDRNFGSRSQARLWKHTCRTWLSLKFSQFSHWPNLQPHTPRRIYTIACHIKTNSLSQNKTSTTSLSNQSRQTNSKQRPTNGNQNK